MGTKYLMYYNWMTMFLCVTLVSFAISYKVGLKYAVKGGGDYGDYSDGSTYGDNSDGSNYTVTAGDAYGCDSSKYIGQRMLAGGELNVPKRLIITLYSVSLGLTLTIIEFMAHSHNGLKAFLFDCNLSNIIHHIVTLPMTILVF